MITPIIHQRFPKSMGFTSAKKDVIRMLMDRLNYRPRKKPWFKSPYGLFFILTPQFIHFAVIY